MSRRTIFDVLNGEIDINEEIFRLELLCYKEVIEGGEEYGYPECSYTLEAFVNDACLKEWKQRNRCLSCEDIRKKLNITDLDIKNKLKGEQILIYLEYIANMIWLCDEGLSRWKYYWSTQYYKFLKENVFDVINSMNYETRIFEDEEKVILVEKNEAATAVAEIIEPELANEVIQYNHYLMKGNIEGKKRILKVLADKIEPMRAEFKKLQKHKELESDIGFLLNKMNIRHNNIKGKNAIDYVKNLSEEEMENWYDETYQLILLCILEYDNIERTKKISELKKNLM